MRSYCATGLMKLSLFAGIKYLSFALFILFILISILCLALEKKSISKWKSERKKKVLKIIFRTIWAITLIIFLVFIAFSSIVYYWKSKGPAINNLENSKTIANPSLVELTTLPDLDLHLYCADGKHIGINYETGEYEIQVPGTIVSGDNQDAPEWIFIPKDVGDCSFVVSSFDNQKFLEENPEIAKDIIDTTDNYEIYGRYIDPANGIYTSQTLTEQPINPGENIIHQTTGTVDIKVSQGVVDNQGPIITHTELKPEYLLNSPAITFNFLAQDEGVGVKEVTASLDGNSLNNGETIAFDRVGTHTITITANDFLGNTNIEDITFNVGYQFSGFLPPIKVDGSGIYKQGRTLPVKFQLTDINNNFVSTAIANLFLIKVSEGIPGGEEIPLSTSNADTGNIFRYDTEDNHYIFNLSTDTMDAGTWQLKVELDDNRYYNVLISIRN